MRHLTLQAWRAYAFAEVKTCQRAVPALATTTSLPSCDWVQESKNICLWRIVEQMYASTTVMTRALSKGGMGPAGPRFAGVSACRDA